jgi:hypothetical protein
MCPVLRDAMSATVVASVALGEVQAGIGRCCCAWYTPPDCRASSCLRITAAGRGLSSRDSLTKCRPSSRCLRAGITAGDRVP